MHGATSRWRCLRTARWSTSRATQWTFFKPPPEDLARLYGVEVQEFVVYRALPEHLEQQAELGRTVIVEVDSFYLPDTAGRSYREKHEKSSIAVESIDIEHERLVYFHGPGLFELEGDDYRDLLRIGRAFSPDVLPPYVELVRTDRLAPAPAEHLREAATELLLVQLERCPAHPVARFGERLAADLPRLLEGDQDAYHEYAFVTVRQCGAAWEATQAFLEWLGRGEDGPHIAAAAHFGALALAAKTLLFKLARSAATARPLDTAPAIGELEGLWEEALGSLRAAVR